jgi:hypothetical protein
VWPYTKNLEEGVSTVIPFTIKDITWPKKHLSEYEIQSLVVRPPKMPAASVLLIKNWGQRKRMEDGLASGVSIPFRNL